MGASTHDGAASEGAGEPGRRFVAPMGAGPSLRRVEAAKERTSGKRRARSVDGVVRYRAPVRGAERPFVSDEEEKGKAWTMLDREARVLGPDAARDGVAVF